MAILVSFVLSRNMITRIIIEKNVGNSVICTVKICSSLHSVDEILIAVHTHSKHSICTADEAWAKSVLHGG